MQIPNESQETVGNILKDGWEPILQWGCVYWCFWDDGELITTVNRAYRDKILLKSKLPLKLIENCEEHFIEDCRRLQKFTVFSDNSEDSGIL